MKSVVPTLTWSLDCECPLCGEFINFADIGSIFPDHVTEISHMIFNNKWDDIDGYDVLCPHCDKDFELGGVEYQ